MSTSQPVLSPAPPASAAIARPDAVRARLVAAVLALGVLLVATVVLWQPWGERDDLSYATLAEHRDGAWLGGLLDGLGMAGVGLGLGVATCLLVRERGRSLATVGAVLAGLGGVLSAGGSIAFGVLVWYVTEPDALSVDAGTEMMVFIDDNIQRLMVIYGAGFGLVLLGSLVLMAALWRARAVPVALPVIYAVLTVAVFLTTGSVMNVVQAAQTLCLAGVAAVLVAESRTSAGRR